MSKQEPTVQKVNTPILNELRHLTTLNLQVENLKVNTIDTAILYLLKQWILIKDGDKPIDVRPLSKNKHKERSIKMSYQVADALKLYQAQTGTTSYEQALISLIRSYKTEET